MQVCKPLPSAIMHNSTGKVLNYRHLSFEYCSKGKNKTNDSLIKAIIIVMKRWVATVMQVVMKNEINKITVVS